MAYKNLQGGMERHCNGTLVPSVTKETVACQALRQIGSSEEKESNLSPLTDATGK